MVVVYGIPACGTVKKARSWLNERGTSHAFVDFRAEPVERERIERWVAAVGAKALRNTSGGSYRALPEDKKNWSEERWTAAFFDDPMLIKRPVVEVDDKVTVGFRSSEPLAQALGV